MPYLLDGNNLAFSLPDGGPDRGEVRRLALERVRGRRGRVILVFDGPPPQGTPCREALGAVTVVWAGVRSADEVILASLPDPSLAREWVVVTNDRELATMARARGAQTQGVEQFLTRRRAQPAADNEHGLTTQEVRQWEEYFARTRPEGDDP